jgi:hypothetical protein
MQLLWYAAQAARQRLRKTFRDSIEPNRELPVTGSGRTNSEPTCLKTKDPESPQDSSKFSLKVVLAYRVRSLPRRCSSGTTRSANSSKHPGV